MYLRKEYTSADRIRDKCKIKHHKQEYDLKTYFLLQFKNKML